MIGSVTFSCSTIKLIHEPLDIESCLKERYTEYEKATMTDPVGRKIYLNKKLCEQLITNHNEAHRND